MSSGFVSGGTIEHPQERDDEWRRAQQELEEKRRAKEEEGRQNDGKSLYEVLQANKAAKQEAFEEATRLKNQFRALDDDEAEFLDSVLETTRKKEAEVQKDTLEQLDAFRKRQEEAERKALEEQNTEGPKEDEAHWVASGRKRKKGHGHEVELLKGVKLRRKSSAAEDQVSAKAVTEAHKKAEKMQGAETKTSAAGSTTMAPKTSVTNSTGKPVPISLALGYASSDDDD